MDVDKPPDGAFSLSSSDKTRENTKKESNGGERETEAGGRSQTDSVDDNGASHWLHKGRWKRHVKSKEREQERIVGLRKGSSRDSATKGNQSAPKWQSSTTRPRVPLDLPDLSAWRNEEDTRQRLSNKNNKYTQNTTPTILFNTGNPYPFTQHFLASFRRLPQKSYLISQHLSTKRGMSTTKSQLKNVCVLGGSYSGTSFTFRLLLCVCSCAEEGKLTLATRLGLIYRLARPHIAGSRAATVLAEQLPPNYRVILIDKQSHFNHLYKFQRHAVVPGHSHKAFVPFTNLLHAPVLSEEQCPAPSKASQKVLQNVVVQASIMNITPTHVEVDSDLCEIEGLSEPELKISSDDGRGKICCCKADGTGCVVGKQKRCAGTRIPYEYLVYVSPFHSTAPGVPRDAHVSFL